MSIYCSGLKNDQDMIRALGSVAIPVYLFTDVCFASVDEKLICIERKKVGDLADCINSGRFLFQMQNCKAAGGDYLVLIVEGRYRRNPDDGLLEVPVWGINSKTGRRAEVWEPVKPTMMFSRFCSYLFELSYLAGIFVFYSENVRGTADIIQCLYSWFQRPDHSSLETIFKHPTPSVQLIRPNLMRRVAVELKGVGWDRSADVANHFRSVAEMVKATEKEWKSIPGIGKKLAKSIVAELNG